MDGLLLIAPDWRDFVRDKIASGFEEPYETEGIRKDGTIFPLRLHAKSIQYHGKVARVVEFRDISDIKKAEQALKENESLLRNIMDSSTDYIFVKDKNLKTILCNKLFAHAVNKKPSDLIGKTDIENGWDAELVKGNPEKRTTGYEKYDLAALSGKSVKNTDTVNISGKTLFLDSVKIPLKDENNKIFGVLGISRDITEKKKAEQSLKESEERLRTLIDTSPFPIVVTDAGHEKILYWSKSAQELFGYQPKTAAEWFTLAYPDPRYRQEVLDRSKPYLERAQHSKTAVNTGEYQIVCRDGAVRICEIYVQSIPGHLVITSNDITKRKLSEMALQKSENLLSQAEEIADLGSWEWDIAADKVYWSKGMFPLFDLDSADGAPCWAEHPAFFVAEDFKRITGLVEKCVQHGTSYKSETRAIRSDGEIRHCLVRGQAVRGENEKIERLQGIFLDITESKQLESKKDHLIDELKQALSKVKKLEGVLPICSHCKKIRDDMGDWQQIEEYIYERSDAQFSHGICPECAKKYYPDYDIYGEKDS